jgi:hypothetical protein
VTPLQKVDEWSTRIEIYLAKAKKYGFMDMLMMEKLSIIMADEEIDKVSDIGKTMAKIFKIEIACIEVLLSIKLKISNRKIIFNIAKGRKTKNYLDRQE